MYTSSPTLARDSSPSSVLQNNWKEEIINVCARGCLLIPPPHLPGTAAHRASCKEIRGGHRGNDSLKGLDVRMLSPHTHQGLGALNRSNSLSYNTVHQSPFPNHTSSKTLPFRDAAKQQFAGSSPFQVPHSLQLVVVGEDEVVAHAAHRGCGLRQRSSRDAGGWGVGSRKSEKVWQEWFHCYGLSCALQPRGSWSRLSSPQMPHPKP